MKNIRAELKHMMRDSLETPLTNNLTRELRKRGERNPIWMMTQPDQLKPVEDAIAHGFITSILPGRMAP